MNEQNEFRAWLHDPQDISDGCMFYNICLMTNNEIWFDGDVCGIDESVKVMQYSGEKDKKGKKIFAGDFVKTNAVKVAGRLIIKFLDGAFCIGLENTNKYNSYVTIRDAKGQARKSGVELEIEVIGNMYEL